MGNLENEAGKNIFEEQQATKFTEESFKEDPAPAGQKMTIDFNFLLAETGDGSIEEYLDHPMNFNNSKGLAQVLRGLTGMFFNLKLAIVDIALGSFRMMMEGKGHGTNNAG